MSKYGYLEVFMMVSSISRYRESTVIGIIEGWGPTALVVGAGVCCLEIFLPSIVSFLSSLSWRRPDID